MKSRQIVLHSGPRAGKQFPMTSEFSSCRQSGNERKSPRNVRIGRGLLLFIALGWLAGCETVEPDGPARAAMAEAISAEQPGSYFIGRRMYKQDYKMWGWIREPGQPWKSARLVMMNEQQKLNPDRASGRLGTDNNYEYRLLGRFSGEQIYEPASDKFYPEFILTGYEVRSASPARIYTTKRQQDPSVRILMPPM